MSTTEVTSPSQPTTLDAWKKADVHEITLPSGAVVTIRPLDLEMHLMLGETPGGLRAHVLQDISRRMESGQMSAEEAAEAQDLAEQYNRHLIVEQLVEPKITEADLPKLPERDTKFLLEVAMRRQTYDAVGKPIGAVPLGDLDVSDVS